MQPLFTVLQFLVFGFLWFNPPDVSGGSRRPYIDSVGYHAVLARLETINSSISDSLIAQALAVQNDTVRISKQKVIFKSIEESYQRYGKLFTYKRRTRRPEIHCSYDLVETFNLLVFDPQPFINAMLHTMLLSNVTTLDFRVEPKNSDTTLLYVALTQTHTGKGTKDVTISEDDCILALTRNGVAVLMTPKP